MKDNKIFIGVILLLILKLVVDIFDARVERKDRIELYTEILDTRYTVDSTLMDRIDKINIKIDKIINVLEK
jgi:hypothetical protein